MKPKAETRPFLFILFFALSTIFYISFRLPNLTNLPVFGDEAIYIRWAQLIRNVETLRFVPLTDGKQPLYMWLTAIALKIIPNPLFAGRLVSLSAGYLTMLFAAAIVCLLLNESQSETNPLVYFIRSLVAKPKVFIISCLAYTVIPFFFFFDRLALADSLLNLFGTSSLLLFILLSRYPRLDLSLLLGFSLGLAALTKSPSIYFFILSACFFLVFASCSFSLRLIYSFTFLLVGQLIYAILRLGPQFHQIAARNLDYVWPLSRLFTSPLDPLIPHLRDIVHIFGFYLTLPIVIVALAVIFNYLKQPKKPYSQVIILLLWSITPLLSNAIFAKVFTARYLLYTITPLFILIIFLYFQHNRHLFFNLFAAFALILCLPILYRMSFSPQTLVLPSTETGYLTDWTSGWGIEESANFLIDRSKHSNVIVGTEGYFGTLPDGLQIYTDGIPHLTIIGQGLGFTEIPQSLLAAKAYGDEVYLLINQSRNKLSAFSLARLTLIEQYPKPDGDYLVLYRL